MTGFGANLGHASLDVGLVAAVAQAGVSVNTMPSARLLMARWADTIQQMTIATVRR